MFRKLNGTRSGHSAHTRLMRRFKDMKSNVEFDRDDLSTTFNLIIDKQSYLLDLNTQIISKLSGEELEAEISDSDEYAMTLEPKISKMHTFLKTTARTSYSLSVTDSSLNPLAQIFDINRNEAASFNSQHILRMDAHILFDEGDQRSFITDGLAEQLELRPQETEVISISGFEGVNYSVRNLKTALIFVRTDDGSCIQLNVLIIPFHQYGYILLRQLTYCTCAAP
ncbi:unnamed protein product [Mytilus coruscus]|uniref:Uncharacterized protein n=1 Tax=Mytilus coruscus TaxID=42192 RepID=A0A6J8A7S0_MYTCO|nr:unnamed protein product [Mytilus coruscus]